MIMQKIKDLFKNFYFLFLFSFLVWMIVIDTNGFINRYRLSKKLSDLKTQFESDDELLEKFSREKYFMKKSSEEIFYIENE